MTDTNTAFNKTVVDAMPATPTLESVMRRAVRWGQQNINVCLPGRVTTVDSRLRVDVQPLLQAQYAVEGAPTTLPIVCGVPVATLSGATWSVSGPVAVGDQGMLIFADRSLDNWLAGAGDPADPQDGRCHHISDAIFLPGLLTDAQAEAAVAGLGSDLVFQNGLAALRLQKAGTLTVGNGQLELMNLLVQLLDALLQAQTNTMLGPQPFLASTLATLGQIRTQLAALEGSQT